LAEKIKKSVFQGAIRTNRDFKQEVQGIAETDLFLLVCFIVCVFPAFIASIQVIIGLSGYPLGSHCHREEYV